MKQNDKRKIANQQAITKIGNALIALMQQKSFSDITVTDIITRAHVARMTYYRNFDSKEEILVRMTDQIMEQYRKEAHKMNARFFSYESILLIFQYFKEYQSMIMPVYKSGLAYLYLEMFDQELENRIGNMKYNDVNRYYVYFYSGALYNVFLKWMSNDMKETPKQMADVTYQLIKTDALLR